MAKGIGNNYFLWVESAVAGTYNMPKGQQTLQRSGGKTKVDTTSKDSGAYKTAAMTLSDWGLKMDMIPDLPDANGYTRLETLCLAYPSVPFNIQIRKGGTAGAGGDVVFQASVYGSMPSGAFDQDKAVTASFEFTLAAAPTTDVLAI